MSDSILPSVKLDLELTNIIWLATTQLEEIVGARWIAWALIEKIVGSVFMIAQRFE